MLEAINTTVDLFKYPKVFQSDNGAEFISDVAKLLDKTQCCRSKSSDQI